VIGTRERDYITRDSPGAGRTAPATTATCWPPAFRTARCNTACSTGRDYQRAAGQRGALRRSTTTALVSVIPTTGWRLAP